MSINARLGKYKSRAKSLSDFELTGKLTREFLVTEMYEVYKNVGPLGFEPRTNRL